MTSRKSEIRNPKPDVRDRDRVEEFLFIDEVVSFGIWISIFDINVCIIFQFTQFLP